MTQLVATSLKYILPNHKNAEIYTTTWLESWLPRQQLTIATSSDQTFKNFCNSNLQAHSARKDYAEFETHTQSSSSINTGTWFAAFPSTDSSKQWYRSHLHKEFYISFAIRQPPDMRNRVQCTNSLGQEVYWPHTAPIAHATIDACKICARKTWYKQKWLVWVIPTSEPLDIDARRIFDLVLRTTQGNQHVIVIKDQYSKVKRKISKAKTTGVHVKNVFSDHRITPYGNSTYLLTENNPQLARKFFETICMHLGLKHFTTTAYHPQSNDYVERHSKTIMTGLRHYVAAPRKECDTFVQPLTCAYNTQAHRSKNATPFRLVLRVRPTEPALLPTKQTHHTDDSHELSVQAKRRALEACIRAMRSRTNTHMRAIQQRERLWKMVNITEQATVPKI